MPFFYDGKCANHLRSLGFKDVVHKQEDFFARVLDAKFLKKIDLIWDNPPYTSAETKERVLRALAASGLPFAMLLPISDSEIRPDTLPTDTTANSCKCKFKCKS